jgi:NADH:ubiquinone oxidoreductase subunit F (NADH-binding)
MTTTSGTDGATTVTPPAGTRRLLLAEDTSLAVHLERYGPLPSRVDLVRLLEQAGLTGHGGAGFPAATKLRGAASRRAGVVVANGAAGEPARAQDRALLQHAPHLVLDGLLLAARATGARSTYVATPSPQTAEVLREQLALREQLSVRRGRLRTEVVVVEDRFISGEESALVNAVEGRPGIPRDRAVPVFERGVRRQPTLVHNVETLAHLALIARFGPAWFRSVGTPEHPGTFLATVSGDVAAPGVHEVEHGAPLPQLIDAAGGPTAGVQAVLVGGFHGAWVPGASVSSTRMSTSSLAPHGASVGAGVVLVLGYDRCGLRESAGSASYLAGQSAGQCGPCVFGLPRLAQSLARLGHPDGDPAVVDEVVRMTALVRGRGACTHPDGTARFAISTLRAFAEDVEEHGRGRCRATPAH